MRLWLSDRTRTDWRIVQPGLLPRPGCLLALRFDRRTQTLDYARVSIRKVNAYEIVVVGSCRPGVLCRSGGMRFVVPH